MKDYNFKQWKTLDIKSEMEGKKALADREYFWDMAMGYKEIE